MPLCCSVLAWLRSCFLASPLSPRCTPLMSIPRSKVTRALVPAVFMMGFVFLLCANLPATEHNLEMGGSPLRSAQTLLEKELAINKPRNTIIVSTDKHRVVHMVEGREESDDVPFQRPLQQALQAYSDAHRTLDLSGNALPAGRKWLIYTPGVVGWGNRLQGMYLGLALSLLTDRTLLVNWNTPVPLSDLVTLHPTIPVLMPSHLLPAFSRLSRFNLNAWDHSKGYSSFPVDVLQNADLNTLSDVQVLDFSAGEDWLPALLSNPHLKHQLQQVFGTRPEHAWSERSLQLVAHELLRFLVRDLSSEARNLLSHSALAPHFGVDPVSSTIGIQIRIGTNNTSFEPFVDLEKDVPKFWACAGALLSRRPNMRIFLATDSIDVKQQALQIYGPERLLFFEGPIVHSGNEQVTDETGKGRSLDGLLKVVVDWWLLGESQYLFRSRQSTFGRSAAVRRPTPSLVLPTQFADGCPLPVSLL